MSGERYQYHEFGEWLYPDFIKEAKTIFSKRSLCHANYATQLRFPHAGKYVL